jgi:hypothetical protein
MPRSVPPLGGAQRRKAHCCWCNKVHRCVGAYCWCTSGVTPTPTAVALSALKRGRAVTRRPSRSRTLKGLALVPCISIGLHHYGMVLLEGITRRQWATHRLPDPHHTRGQKVFIITSQRQSCPVASDCIIVLCLRLLADRLLADRLHGCALSSISAQGISRAPMAADPPGVAILS